MKPILCGVILALLSPSLFAATRTWTGAADANWNNAANWGGAGPVAGDDLVFPGTGANQVTTNNFPVGTAFHSLTLSGGAYTLNGNMITLGAGGIVTTGGTSPHTINLSITLAAPQTWQLEDAGGTVTTDVESPSTNLNGRNLRLTGSASGQIFWGSVISGTGAIVLQDIEVILGGVSSTLAPLVGNNSIVVFDRNSAYPGAITLSGTFAVAEVGKGSVEGPVTINGSQQGVFFADEAPGGTVGNLSLKSLVLYPEQITSATVFGQVNVNGTVSLGNTLLEVDSSASLPPGTQLTILNNDGTDPIVGTFIGAPEGATVPALAGPNTQNFTISYVGGTGNDIVLTAGPLVTTQTNTAVAASVNPIAAGNPLTLTATVTPASGTAVPTGTVTFIDVLPGPTLILSPIGTATLNASGVATLTVPAPLLAGDHQIIAIYSGGGVFGSSNDGLTLTVTGSSASIPTLDPRVLALLAVVLAALGAFALKVK